MKQQGGRRRRSEEHQQQQHTEMEDTDATTFNPTTDICAQLMQRYSASAAVQHRHLIATAAAIKSLIEEDSAEPTPLAYFAAAMSALSTTTAAATSPPQYDAASSAALATLLSIALSLVPQASIPSEHAAEAASVLVRVLGDGTAAAAASASAVRCVVKCLGVLLGFCELTDWNSIELPFQTLLNWSIDKRPKVRKCALGHLENALKSFQSEIVTEKASRLILSSLENCMSSAGKLGLLRKSHGPKGDTHHHEAECADIVHVLGVVRVSLPYFSNQLSVEVVKKLVELLDARFSAFTRLILGAIEVFFDKADPEVIALVDEPIVDALVLYLSIKTNSTDSLVLAANLLKTALDKMHSGDTIKWRKCFPPGVKAIAGLLTCEDDIASKCSSILKNLIDHQFVDFESNQAIEAGKDEESNAVASICSVFMSLLESSADISIEHTLAVVSVLFLKLGRNSSLYMRNIVLKIAEILVAAIDNECDTSHLQKCFGCAVVALGAEDILSLVPFSFNAENLTCSNVWLLPILKKYTFGASLRYFMDHIVPVAKSLQKAARKVKKSVTGQDLQAHARGLWGLLPAFCRHPTDISQSFQSLAKLMLVLLKKKASWHELIAEALQELVRRDKCGPKYGATIAESPEHSSDILLENDLMENRGLISFSKKDEKLNIKALSSQSKELLQALMSIFLDSPTKNRSSLKKAIGCLASITKASSAKKIFISSLERFPPVKAVIESGDLSDGSQNETGSSMSDGSQWSMSLDLASSVVKGADEEFLSLIFRLAKHSLQVGDETGVREAYYTLSCILMEHPVFCTSNLDELVDLMSILKSPADNVAFSNRLSCLRIMLVSVLKSSSDVENTKPFLILNFIILALKDSKEETRKIAYDELLKISSCLEESSSADSCELYYKLISMILGYLSGPSPHITSAAISALSVLVFKEPELCVKVPDLVPSVTSLLQSKAVEVTKAVLGFVKVLVSCMEGKDLHNFASDIVDGLLPWSAVSRHHFRSKVTVIVEIMIRKCGFPAVKLVTPERYQTFIKKVSLNRQGKTATKDADSVDMKRQSSDASTIGSNKRMRTDDSSSRFDREKRQRQSPSDPRGRVGKSDFRSNRAPNNQFNKQKTGIARNSGKPNTNRAFGRPRQNGPRNNKPRGSH